MFSTEHVNLHRYSSVVSRGTSLTTKDVKIRFDRPSPWKSFYQWLKALMISRNIQTFFLLSSLLFIVLSLDSFKHFLHFSFRFLSLSILHAHVSPDDHKTIKFSFRQLHSVSNRWWERSSFHFNIAKSQVISAPASVQFRFSRWFFLHNRLQKKIARRRYLRLWLATNTVKSNKENTKSAFLCQIKN